MVDNQSIPKDVVKKLFEYGTTEVRPCDTFDKLLQACKSWISSAKQLERFYFPCRVCDDPVILDENIIRSTIRWMRTKWVCTPACENK